MIFHLLFTIIHILSFVISLSFVRLELARRAASTRAGHQEEDSTR